MHRSRLLPVLAVTGAALPAGVVPAQGASTAVPSLPAPAPVPVTPAPAPAPASGQVKLELQKVGGSPPFALVGGRIVVRGTVTPYVAGQTVKVSFYLEGRKVGVETVGVLARPRRHGPVPGRLLQPSGGARKGARRALRHAPAGRVQRALRRACASSTRTSGWALRASRCRLLQSELDVLHYAVPLTGVLDEGTGRALIAYRKMTGLERIPYAGRKVFELLGRHAGSFHVRYPGTAAMSRRT